MATPEYEPGIGSHDHGAVCRGRGGFVSKKSRIPRRAREIIFMRRGRSAAWKMPLESFTSQWGGGFVAAHVPVRLISNRIS